MGRTPVLISLRSSGEGFGEENWGQSWEPLAPLKDFPSPHRSSWTQASFLLPRNPLDGQGPLSFSGRLCDHSPKVLPQSQSLGATRGVRRCFPRWGRGAETVPSGHPAPALESSMRLMSPSPLHLDVSR